MQFVDWILVRVGIFFSSTHAEEFMKRRICFAFLPVIALTGCFTQSVQAQYLDQIGVTLLRTTTTNLNGSGIRVAQPEASGDYLAWQVNPISVGQPVNLFTYISSNGTASTFPNALGSESGHADNVANQFYGITNGVATNVAHVDSYEVDDFLNNYIFATLPVNINASVVNQSFTFGPQPVANQQIIDSLYDNYSDQYGTLFVSAADNYGTSPPSSTNVCAPGTSYNCICVGSYANGNFGNSLGPTADNGRCKPDITALASGRETSYTTPQVAGAAAVMMQAALHGDGGSDTNSAADMLTIKALLLNGAVKPANWTNSNASPLDARYGAGVLNVFNAYKQLAGGKHGYIASETVTSGGTHPPTGSVGTISALSGWDFNNNAGSNTKDRVNHYYFNVTNELSGASFAATATLVWGRHNNPTYQISPIGINNLNLFLYNCANSNLVTCSTSLVDNVEHIFVPKLPQGRYDLQVWKAAGSSISTSETYALAFAFTSTELSITNDGINTALTWPVYPDGFKVEAADSLTAPVWSSSQLPAAVFTNGQNVLLLNPTNDVRFFRLHQMP